MPDVVVVQVPTAPTVVVTQVATAPTVVQVSTGVPGVQGPAGAPGDSNAFEYAQTTALGTWTIPIPAGFARRPNVTVYSPSGELVIADVVSSLSTVSITFASPASGFAVLS